MISYTQRQVHQGLTCASPRPGIATISTAVAVESGSLKIDPISLQPSRLLWSYLYACSADAADRPKVLLGRGLVIGAVAGGHVGSRVLNPGWASRSTTHSRWTVTTSSPTGVLGKVVQRSYLPLSEGLVPPHPPQTVPNVINTSLVALATVSGSPSGAIKFCRAISPSFDNLECARCTVLGFRVTILPTFPGNSSQDSLTDVCSVFFRDYEARNRNRSTQGTEIIDYEHKKTRNPYSAL